MINFAKRRTLKLLSVAGLGSATLGSSAVASVLNPVAISTHDASGADVDVPPLATITVDTRVSSTTNDIEVVLTNTGSESTTITHLTPSRVQVGRGDFDFAKLLSDGDLRLAAGQSVTVPLQSRTTNVSADHARKVTGSLVDYLRRTMSVITDGNAYASVTLAPKIAVA